MKTKQTGFTLIELMVTLAVAIIVLAIGVPMYGSMISNNRAVAQVNSLVTAINLAKNEAISKNVSVTICSDADGDSSTFVCGTNAQWTNGWFVFRDDDADGVRDSGEDIIKIWESMEPGSNVTTSSTAAGALRFSSLGEYTGTAAINFLLTQDGSIGNQSRCVYVNLVGQIRVEKRTSC